MPDWLPLAIFLTLSLLLTSVTSYLLVRQMRKAQTEALLTITQTVTSMEAVQLATLDSLRTTTNLVATQDPMVFGNLQAMTSSAAQQQTDDSPYPKDGDEIYVDHLKERGVDDDGPDGFDRSEFGA